MQMGHLSNLDHMIRTCVRTQVAGAIAAGTGVFDTLLKECEEEASISVELASCAKPIGTIRLVNIQLCPRVYSDSMSQSYYFSYFHEASDGLEPETEFIYELELPADCVPVPQDGEVSEFYLWDIEQVCLF